MAITNIKSVKNLYGELTWYVRNVENEADTGGKDNYVAVDPNGGEFRHDMWIPWADDQGELQGHRIVITNTPNNLASDTTFTIWQSGDFVWFSRNGRFGNGKLINGTSHEGGDRSVQINGTGTTVNDTSITFF